MSQKFKIAIVGSESLLGRELREILREQRFPVSIRLLGIEEDVSVLTEHEGEAAVIPPFDEDSLSDSDLAFLAGTPESSRRALELLANAEKLPLIVDLSYATEDDPWARLRAPQIELSRPAFPPRTYHVIAHPAAIALALLITRLAENWPLRRVIALILEPASERGQRGLEELRQQTVNLLSFQPLPKQVFDAQLGFNLLASYGSDAPESLAAIELRIEKHLATLLSQRGISVLPSLRLIQAPVFHGHSISVYVEFESAPDLGALTSSLSSPLIDVRAGDLTPPDNVGMAGQSGIAVGSIAADRNDARCVWFWLVADNLRLMAENAVAVARRLLRVDEGIAG